MKPNTAKASLDAKKKLLGCWLQLVNPVVGEMMGLCGYDFVLIDLEHGLGTIPDAANVMRAVRGTGASSFVRMPTNDAITIRTLMDQGVDGIMVPMVETPEAARAVVQACRYPPKGVRGLAIGIVRGADYGMDDAYVETVDDHTVVICQIETVEGVRRAKEIAEVDGVDMLFVGRNDLAADSGHILDLDHPEVEAMTDEVMAVAHAAGKTVGTVPSAARNWQKLLSDGFDLVIPSSDISILRSFGQEEVAAFRTATNQGRQSKPVTRGY